MWVLGLAGAFYFLAVTLGVAARWELGHLARPGLTNATYVDGVVRIPEQALLLLASEIGGAPLLALVATAALAAIFSTVAGLLIAAAASWGHDVYEQFINPSASEKRRVVLGQGAVIATATVGAALSLALYRFGIRPSVALMVTWAFALAGSAFTPVFLLAVWYKRLTAQGAITGMIVGASIALVAIGADLAVRPEDAAGLGSLASFPTIVAAPVAVLAAVGTSLLQRTPAEPVTMWLQLHGTAAERRQAELARLTAGGGELP